MSKYEEILEEAFQAKADASTVGIIILGAGFLAVIEELKTIRELLEHPPVNVTVHGPGEESEVNRIINETIRRSAEIGKRYGGSV